MSTEANFMQKRGNETILASGALALFVAIGGVALWASADQDAGIKASISSEGSAHISDFKSVATDGIMFNYNKGSLHNATVTLASGTKCSVQFTPESDTSFWSQIAPNHARIVSYGTCPTDVPVLK